LFFPLQNYALCSLCEQRAQLSSSEGRAKKDFIDAFLLGAFWFVEKRSPQRWGGAKKEYIFIYIFSLYPRPSYATPYVITHTLNQVATKILMLKSYI